ncbi:hypothetical protein CASFOL_026156 [Castilleja foliolosa]|uniref:MULE transposase domain-containing protein n=1 Tax=Castilleja foliolosa TaxID=1961234 RepID=A0ABD3CKN9_9LAMI
MLEQTIPDSVTALKTNLANDKFESAFYALGPAIRGYRDYGRHVIVVDGTFLTGKYRGIVFVAVTQDSNKQVYPLAVGVGHVENEDTWTWFLRQLENAYGSPDDLLIVSDGAKSIQNAIKTVFPSAKHGLCIVHMIRNMRSAGETVVQLFKDAAYAFDLDECYAKLALLQQAAPNTYTHIMNIGIKRWSRSYCPVSRYHYTSTETAI